MLLFHYGAAAGHGLTGAFCLTAATPGRMPDISAVETVEADLDRMHATTSVAVSQLSAAARRSPCGVAAVDPHHHGRRGAPDLVKAARIGSLHDSLTPPRPDAPRCALKGFVYGIDEDRGAAAREKVDR